MAHPQRHDGRLSDVVGFLFFWTRGVSGELQPLKFSRYTLVYTETIK